MVKQLSQIEESIIAGQRLSADDAHWLWHNISDDDWQRLATIVRNRFHKSDLATYVIMRIINYTNVCVAKCDYCAFYRLPRDKDAYLLPREEIFAKIDELKTYGGDLVAFNGGFNPNLKIDYYADLFGSIRKQYGDSIEFYAMTVVELLYVARLSGISAFQAAKILKDAGVRWITGGGAEILADSFRLRHSPQKYTVQEYFDAQQAIVEAGLKTTATMVIGFDESFEERMEHLNAVRQFQDTTKGGLFSFLAWTYKPYQTELGGKEITASEYLRHLALSRVYLDNIKHIRTSVLTQNANALKGLHFGADDFDVPLEDEVTQMAGAVVEKDVSRILGYAANEGFKTNYRQIAKQPDPALI